MLHRWVLCRVFARTRIRLKVLCSEVLKEGGRGSLEGGSLGFEPKWIINLGVKGSVVTCVEVEGSSLLQLLQRLTNGCSWKPSEYNSFQKESLGDETLTRVVVVVEHKQGWQT